MFGLLVGVWFIAFGALYVFKASAIMDWSRKRRWNTSVPWRLRLVSMPEYVIFVRAMGALFIAMGAISLSAWAHLQFKL
jgi:hypothetical protein